MRRVWYRIGDLRRKTYWMWRNRKRIWFWCRVHFGNVEDINLDEDNVDEVSERIYNNSQDLYSISFRYSQSNNDFEDEDWENSDDESASNSISDWWYTNDNRK